MRYVSIFSIALLFFCCTASGQLSPLATTQTGQNSAPLTLQEVIQRAKANSPEYLAAQAEFGLAREDRVQARAALLPNITYNNQFLYTEGNGTPSGRFIANNAVHEYVSQGNAHEVISLAQFATFRRTAAAEAVARARAEIASRGLVLTAVDDFYALLAAQRKFTNADTAMTEALNFFNLSKKLEAGGEVAHADVLKAQIQYNDRSRDLQEAALALLRSKLGLAVLIFPNLHSEFTVLDDLDQAPDLPQFPQVEQEAIESNPELRAALASVQASHQDVIASRAEHLPELQLDYFYGIDSTHFAVRTDGIRNLGYAATATLSIPIFSWGATQSRVRQSEIRERQSKVVLSATQRQVLANIQIFYKEAQAASVELAALRQTMDLASESLRLTTLRYQAGESTVLEVADAQNTLVTARDAYADGSARYRVALANLQTLTGTL
jgi:outer membrane protein TolC